MRSTTVPTFTEQARRDQIITAATTVIATEGYAQASIARIAEQIGIAKSVVLYHFKTKNDIIEAVVAAIFTAGAAIIVPAVAETASGSAGERLAAYIRANVRFIDQNRTAAIAMLEILTGYRSPTGLRLDQAAAAAPEDPALAGLDPEQIFSDGVGSGEFRPLSPRFMKNALRAALDGAAWELARDPEYDVIGYGEELVTAFTLASGRPT